MSSSLLSLSLVSSSYAQGLTIVSTLPADTASGVPLETEVEFRFDHPLDTTGLAAHASEAGNGLPIGAFIGPRESITVGSFELLDQRSRLRIAVEHQPETDYAWIVTGASGADSTSLDVPHILRYTTASEWGAHTVRGFVARYWLLKSHDPDTRDVVVALFSSPPSLDSDWNYIGFDRIVAAVGVPGNGEFRIDRVRDGTYWPVAFIDVNENGRIDAEDRVGPYGETEPDSIVVQGDDVNDIFIGILIGGSAEAPEAPSAARFGTIHPNPTQGTARVEWELARPAVVSVRLYNMWGQEVRALVADEWLPSGSHQAQVDASALAAGAYLCRLSVDGSAESRILFVMK